MGSGGIRQDGEEGRIENNEEQGLDGMTRIWLVEKRIGGTTMDVDRWEEDRRLAKRMGESKMKGSGGV